MHAAKEAIAVLAALCFVGLGTLDLMHHELKVGVASFALGLANALLLI